MGTEGFPCLRMCRRGRMAKKGGVRGILNTLNRMAIQESNREAFKGGGGVGRVESYSTTL